VTVQIASGQGTLSGTTTRRAMRWTSDFTDLAIIGGPGADPDLRREGLRLRRLVTIGLGTGRRLHGRGR